MSPGPGPGPITLLKSWTRKKKKKTKRSKKKHRKSEPLVNVIINSDNKRRRDSSSSDESDSSIDSGVLWLTNILMYARNSQMKKKNPSSFTTPQKKNYR
mmetsp:Transcript_9624/g.16909  ORF Transcript_9624/g.16909 Transcript_9624/m.16909 type:complete len:99 (+) Transcript_9624:303-599(+)